MTRIEAVRIAIEELERQRRIFSKDRIGLQPQPGGEEIFYKMDAAIREMKELCQALQTEGVRKSIAAWQQDIMKHPDAVQLAMKDLEPAG